MFGLLSCVGLAAGLLFGVSRICVIGVLFCCLLFLFCGFTLQLYISCFVVWLLM